MKKAVVLFSGGLDSTTCLAIASQEYNQVFALSFDYNQRHKVELEAAKNIAKDFHVTQHYIIPISMPNNNTSSLTNKNIQVPDYNQENQEVPNTYVPARNTIFLSYALSLAEAIAANSIYIGCSSVDYSGYPDCRPEYIKAFSELINLAIENHKIELKAPLMHLNKADTIKLGLSLGVDYSKTISCYNATIENPACHACDSCKLRQKGFATLNQEKL